MDVQEDSFKNEDDQPLPYTLPWWYSFMRLYLFSEEQLITSIPLPKEWSHKTVDEICNLAVSLVDQLPVWLSKDIDCIEVSFTGKVNYEIKDLFN